MKWTEQQVAKLKELCNEGKSNKDIADIMRCKVTDIYAKRSQLGITVDKVKAAQQTQTDKIIPALQPKKAVEQAFLSLHDALHGAAASDLEESSIYSDVAALILSAQSLLYAATKKRGECQC